MVSATTIAVATGFDAFASMPARLATDSPMTSEMIAVDAQVEIQSIHPTRKPA